MGTLVVDVEGRRRAEERRQQQIISEYGSLEAYEEHLEEKKGDRQSQFARKQQVV